MGLVILARVTLGLGLLARVTLGLVLPPRVGVRVRFILSLGLQ